VDSFSSFQHSFQQMNNMGDLPRPKGPAQYICFDADLTRQIGKYWAHLLNILLSANEPSIE